MSNVNPINRVVFGQEKTREDYLARAAWEYEQASRLRAARRPVGYMALVEGHERAAKKYEQAAEGRPSEAARMRAHATAGGLKIGDAVQFRWEPGTGGVIRRFEQDEAIVATPRGERRVPADALAHVREEHVARVRRSVEPRSTTTSHARIAKTKLVHVVQGNYGYGHGWEDLTAEENRKEARDRLREYRENERGTPFRLIRRRERIEGAGGGGAHARKKKISPRDAKQLLKSDGIDFGRDFHELGSQEVQRILEVARLAGYRKRKDAPGSTARMYFQYLSRQP